MQEATAEELFLAWRSRSDLRALAQVFDETAPELYAVARHLARGTSEAEDLVQGTFLAAIERAASYDPARPLRPWLFGILGHEARKLRARRAAEEFAGEVRTQSGPLEALLASELHGAVAQAVESLPPHYASAVALHLEQGLPPREIAPRLGISDELARTHLSRGLAWLRRALPEGLATGAWLAGSDLAALRGRVLARAGLAQATAPALPVFLLSALLLLPLCVIGGGVVWLLGASAPASLAASEAHAAPVADAQPPLESVSPSAARAPVPAAPVDARVHLHGRILLANGAPAAGAEVRASTFSMAELRSIDLGAVRCDERGTFAFALELGASDFVSLRTQPAGHVNAGGNFGPLAPGGDTDTGELVLPRAGVLVGKLVDAEARPIAEGWELMSSADAPQTHPANKLWRFWSVASFDPATGLARLDGLPAGEMKVVARTKLGFDQIQAVVRIVEGGETQAEFRYDGPDLTRRILLRARPRIPGLVVFHPAASSIGLQKAGEEKARKALAPARRAPGEYLFDDLPEGEYELAVDDPQFERWSEPHARPGHAYSAALDGAAAVKLSVLGPDGAPLARYGLRITFPDANFRPNTAELRAKNALAPEGGLVKGLIPTHCTLLVQPEGLPERSLDVPALRRGETRELTLDYRGSVALVGRVVDESGKPLAGVDVELTRGERAGEDAPGVTQVVRAGKLESVRPIEKRAKTDAGGAFRFAELERGTWTVRARFSRWLAADKTLALAPDSAPLELARPPGGFLVGRVQLPAGVDPAGISLMLDDDLAPPRLQLAQDGSLRLGPLPVGTHTLRANVPASARAEAGSNESFGSLSELGRFEIVAGRDTERIFDLGGSLPFRLDLEVRAGGVPLEQGWVAAVREDGEAADSIALGKDGRAILGITAPARVRIAVVAHELGWVWTSEERLSPAAGATLERKLDVPLVKRRLRCLDAATGAPLAGAEIRWSAKLAGLEAAARAQTDAKGELELALPAGTHEFRAGTSEKAAPVEWKAGGSGVVELRLPSAR